MNLVENLLLVLVALLLVVLNAFFVAAEFAIVKLRHTRVEELARINGLRGRVLALVHQRMDAYLSACQLGITLASLGLGWIGEPAFAQLLETPLAALGLGDDPATVHGIAFACAFGTISYLHIVVGELAPKSAALRRPEAMSLWTALPLYLFYWLMYPFIRGLNASANWMLRRVGLGEAGAHAHDAPYSNDELRMILHLSRAAPAGDDAGMTRLLSHALDLPRLHASDVMRNRRELISLHTAMSHAEIRRVLARHRYSRYPLLEAGTGAVLGILHIKDIYPEADGADYMARLQRLLHPVAYVPEDRSLARLLHDFRAGSTHLALVRGIDDQPVGFLSMEDVLEAVFGEITDEHEKRRIGQLDREPRRLASGVWLLRGDTPLFKLERELGEDLPESERLNTVSGLLMARLDGMPTAGSEIGIGRYTARVLRMRGPFVDTVRLTRRLPVD